MLAESGQNRYSVHLRQVEVKQYQVRARVVFLTDSSDEIESLLAVRDNAKFMGYRYGIQRLSNKKNVVRIVFDDQYVYFSQRFALRSPLRPAASGAYTIVLRGRIKLKRPPRCSAASEATDAGPAATEWIDDCGQ